MDYHLHSQHSFDGKSTLSAICNSAVNKGIKEVCFTEHFSVDPEVPTYGYLDFHKYFSEIDECKNKYSKNLIIRKGVEICEPHLNSKKLQQTLKDKDLDFIIGSVHNIDKLKLRNYIKNKNNFEAYKGYFKEVYNAVSLGDMDILGHLDLLKRYAYNDLGNYIFPKFEDILTKILKKLIERNIGLELNTSGLRSDVKEIFPSVHVLKLYKNLGGEIITIGSDSHSSELIGEGFKLGINILKSCDFKYVFTFEKRKPNAVKI
ncbi:histidinol-phosphatase HisJ family protein [Clostridium ganghwense]|uniref:Histidinol-phosphatase n=1 Tax=Clostridium ganghwense TaxID=312089 RepID=A0ABT4CQ11_9CLOT|nr:histidinol-phosphatase HisJ family protein [Clostridium ganghwense]MCY6371043.1 histidinol-phosphatase HisJ family protein [Clostridium ganghwense]